jgi:hypothetical protein
MTQHHDPVHPDEGDLDPVDELSASDDAYVSELLAGLSQPSMPTDVAARIDAALAVTAAAEPVVPLLVGTTVVPLSTARSHWRSPRTFQIAAALVLVIGAGIVGVKALAGTSSSESIAAAPGTAAGSAAPLTRSDHAYTTDSLADDVQQLVAGKLPTAAALAGGSTAASAQQPGIPSPKGTVTSPDLGGGSTATNLRQSAQLQDLTSSAAKLAPCIAALEEGISYVQPYAIDAGTFNGQPALIVVLPNAEDPKSYDVFVSGPACGQNHDDHLIAYVLVPRA